ncbi:MAG: biopolymer transporter ExbD [Verrucomicrobiaceae bacterium]|nr:biopolymer transporter ExbD [Verrucomicrobiaceae bacterium]
MSTDSILHWLLRTTVEGSALILAVLAIRRLMSSRLTPSWRVALWSVVALKLLVPASLPTIGLGTLLPSISSDRVTFTEGSRGPQPTDSVFRNVLSRRGQETATTATGSVFAGRSDSNHRAEGELKPTATFLDPYAIILVAWLVGVVAMLSIAVVRDVRFRRRQARWPVNEDRRLAAHVRDVAHVLRLPRTPRILITEASTVPSVTGLHSPALLMPRDWESQFTADELDSILRHELLHLRHHDLWLNWFAALVNALQWFNPLVWLAVARCQEDRELRCDERALSIASSEQRIAYGRTLLRLAEHFITPPAIAGVAPCVRNHPLLRERILMITNPASHRPWLHALCSLALGALVIISFGSARAQEGKPNRTREGERSSPEAGAPRKAGEENGAARKGEADGMKKRGDGDGAAKSGARDGDGAKKTGARDGEGMTKSAEGDGARKAGPRDGEGTRKPGMRDGEGGKKSAEGDGARKPGPRDGEGSRKSGARDGKGVARGEGSRKNGEGTDELVKVSFPNSPLASVFPFYTKLTGKDVLRSNETDRVMAKIVASRPLPASEAVAFIEASLLLNGYAIVETDNDRVVKCVKASEVSASETATKGIKMRVTDGGDTIIINGEKVPHARLRGHLSEFLPEHRGEEVTIEADDDVPFKSVADVLDAARDNGAKNARITGSKGGER